MSRTPAGDFAEVTDGIPDLVGPARSLAELVAQEPGAWQPP